MSAFKQQCIELRKKDYTLPEIVRITGRPKTSVYFHIKDTPLSPSKRGGIRNANRAHLLKIAALRKGKSARGFKRFERWNINSVSLIAHLIFDGEIRYGGCSYNNRNEALIAHVVSAMRRVYAYEPKRYLNRTTGVFRISYFNVALGEYVQNKARALLEEIATMQKPLKRVFLQSFFDDEGCMDFRLVRNLRQIRGYQKNVEILHLVQLLLRDFGIISTVISPNEVKMVGEKNLRKFQKEINFSPGVRINGDRPNSVWKQHLEKREILRRAIASYKPLGSNGVHRR